VPFDGTPPSIAIPYLILVECNNIRREAVVVATIQEGLTHAASLSRYFWPMKTGGRLAAARGERLRTAFELTDESPLKSRLLRNTFEHFDERLDRFLLNDIVGCFFPSPTVGSHELSDNALGNFFKLVDRVHGICVLLGDKVEFRPIRGEVQRILKHALQMSDRGSRL